jgi:hypothetical protein
MNCAHKLVDETFQPKKGYISVHLKSGQIKGVAFGMGVTL